MDALKVNCAYEKQPGTTWNNLRRNTMQPLQLWKVETRFPLEGEMGSLGETRG